MLTMKASVGGVIVGGGLTVVRPMRSEIMEYCYLVKYVAAFFHDGNDSPMCFLRGVFVVSTA